MILRIIFKYLLKPYIFLQIANLQYKFLLFNYLLWSFIYGKIKKRGAVERNWQLTTANTNMETNSYRQFRYFLSQINFLFQISISSPFSIPFFQFLRRLSGVVWLPSVYLRIIKVTSTQFDISIVVVAFVMKELSRLNYACILFVYNVQVIHFLNSYLFGHIFSSLLLG